MNNAKEIFFGALDCASPEDLARYLDEACQGDAALQQRVEELLRAHRDAGSFLGGRWPLATEELAITESAGTLIGPYKLLEQIGEGGMGVVYMADQQTPVRRRVAVKVIKVGMDTRQVIARFEAERQALALMDHANIARVLDAGATDTGRPYFVMELVRGIPITEYCDQNNLPVHERLELFVQVCHAVQHAHQKGIIHRDLKPSNVLVTLHDGRAVPKVIDFGVAKATGQQLTEKTLFTAFAQMIGTPLYMSPEQAEMTSIDIDTRSDIYSLGVLLYELLTGTTPFDQQRMRAAAFDEIRRIIREEEPPKPSTRISTLGESRTATAAHRQVDSHRLSGLVKGELDWIAMKCLEKDRNRRYETASSLAMDLQRYFNDEPVDARQATRLYRLKKFIRRNRAAMTSACAVIALLVAVVVILALTNARIRRESGTRAIALQAKEAALATTRRVIQQLAALDTQISDRLTEIPGGEPIYRAMKEDTLRYLEPILKQAEMDPDTNYEAYVLLETLADIQVDLGRLSDARRTAQFGIDVVQKKLDAEPENLTYLRDLGRAKECMVRVLKHQLTAENEHEFVTYCNELLDLRRQLILRQPERPPPTAHLLRNLGEIALNHGKKDTAKRLFRDGIALRKERLRNQSARGGVEAECACWMAIRLGQLIRDDPTAGVNAAVPFFEQSLAWAQEALQASPSQLMRFTASWAEFELGVCRYEQKNVELAIPLVEHATAQFRRLSLDFPMDAKYHSFARLAQGTLVRQLQHLGRANDAEKAARQMADWLKEISRQVPADPNVESELQRADTETAELLRQPARSSKKRLTNNLL